METTQLIEVVNTLGFPVAVCGALFWLLIRVLKSYNEVLKDIKTSIDNNTIAIAEISKAVERIRKDV